MNMIFGMRMHATFILKCSKCRLCMQQCNAMENCTMTFFPSFVILILIWLFCFFVENIDWLSLFEKRDDSCNLILFFANLFGDCLRVYVLFDHLKILEWRHKSRFTLNQSTELLILGFSPFLLKTLIILHSKKNIRLWDRSCVPLKDDNELSHFGMWPSETFLI